VFIAEVNFFGRHKGSALRDGVLLSVEQAVEREPLCLQLDQREICSFPPPSYG
jgi:hypothetical protein